MNVSRRGLGIAGRAAAMAMMSGASSGVAQASRPAPRSNADPLDGVELYKHVLDYCGFGEHRSGSLVDERTSQSIFDHLKSAGFETSFQTEPMR